MASPKIKFKRSAVASKRPSLSNLELGELALNTYDGKLFLRRDTSGVGIGTTVSMVNPWVENYGGTGISYSGTINATGITTFANTVNLGDNNKLKFGEDSDLEIYHDGSHSYIDDAGTGNLNIRSGTLSIQNLAGSKTSAVFNSGAGQQLNFNNNKRFETTSHGAVVTGILTATTLSGNLSATNVTAGIATVSSAFYMPQYTTNARDSGSFNEGAIIYNTTTKKIEFYDGTTWNTLPGMTIGLTVALDS